MNNIPTAYYELIIAALLHDIGKFKERAFGGKEHSAFPKNMEGIILPLQKEGYYSHRHALWTYDFFENDLMKMNIPKKLEWIKIKDLASKHHNASEGDELIIDMADNISASGDRSEETDYERGGHLKRHLRSLFTQIYLDESNETKNKKYGYNLKSISPEDVYPFELTNEDESLDRDYKQLWDKFIADCKTMLDAYKPEYGLTQFVQMLISLMEKYCWCIPSATNDKFCNTSLFDHAITTAAISIALKRFKEEGEHSDKPFLFFAGDISGIQQFIFQHKQESFRGASKVIRGRSFYISMIAHAYIYALCNELGLPPFVNLLNAGGKFTLILPNLKTIKQKLDDFVVKVDEWFYNHWHGDFTIIYDYSITADQEEMNLKNFRKLISQINKKLEIAKMNKFKNILSKGNCVIDIDYSEEELCKSCGRYAKQLNTEEDRCEHCNSMFAVGSKLTKESIIVFSAEKGDVNYFNKLYISIIDSLTAVRDFIVAYTLDEDDMIPSAKRGLPLLYINNYVPQHNGATLTFDEIANSSLQQINKQDDKEQFVGTKLLAYIKADVDNMGFIFGYGIDDLSISRYVSLSRMLHIFFNLVVKDLIKKTYKNIYTVLSGGDDLFVIAPWDECIHFILDVENRFKQFVCQNKDLHFSTGVCIQKPNYPISKAAADAEVNLEHAKDKGKNRIIYFSDLQYNELHEVHKDAAWLIQQNNSLESNISHSFLYRLLTYSRMAKKVFSKKFQPSDLMYIPYLKYDISRNIVQKKENRITNMDEIQKLLSLVNKYAADNPNILEVAVTVAIYKTRIKTLHKEEA